MSIVKIALKSVLHPIRRAAGRFVVSQESLHSSIIWKAAQITSAELVEGDYLEFGVFRGDSFIQAFKTIEAVYRERCADQVHIGSRHYRARVQELWSTMRFFAFDSFQGLPAIKGLDALSNEFAETNFACPLDDFMRNLWAASVDASKVVVVPGYFDDTCRAQTIEKHGMKAGSIIHIDCDLYESAKACLNFILPLLVDGTVLIFDDWYCFRGNPALGEQRAFAEWASGLTEWTFTQYQKDSPWNNSFVANRREKCTAPL
jgi:hypothetical protein